MPEAGRTIRCPTCDAEVPVPPARGAPGAAADAPTTLRGRLPRRYQLAWLGIAGLFVLGVLWANRYEYHECDVDGCVRVDRWTGRVGWVWSDSAGEEGMGEEVRAITYTPPSP